MNLAFPRTKSIVGIDDPNAPMVTKSKAPNDI